MAKVVTANMGPTDPSNHPSALVDAIETPEAHIFRGQKRLDPITPELPLAGGGQGASLAALFLERVKAHGGDPNQILSMALKGAPQAAQLKQSLGRAPAAMAPGAPGPALPPGAGQRIPLKEFLTARGMTAHHEQSETVSDEPSVAGAATQWRNIYGRGTPQAGQDLPIQHDYEQPSYADEPNASAAAVLRSKQHGDAANFTGLDQPARRQKRRKRNGD